MKMDELKKRAQSLKNDFLKYSQRINLSDLEDELQGLRRQMNKSGFWQDNRTAQEVSKKEAAFARRFEPWGRLSKEIDELAELADLGDSKMLTELESQADRIESELDKLKKETRFSGQYDHRDVILSIYAGAGGTDAQDWTQMLLRMYTRWAEKERLKVKMIGQSAGEEAGLKSVSIEITGGDYLYGKLAGEHGVHRLVRLSPFNADHLRQTSFAKVEVLPAINSPDEVEIDEKDIKVDVFRAGGHGGQSVNTTDSAVRVTHVPTGINVSIQNERSQLQNKETAMTVLRSRLAQLQIEQHKETISDIKGPSQSAEWGNQIRNYVLHPYKQVKDMRTGFESSDVEKVLDGSLEPVIDAYLEAL